MVERKWKIEGLFAEAKLFHSLRRARYRGLSKVSIQALMTAIAQNLKRIAKNALNWLCFLVFKLPNVKIAVCCDKPDTCQSSNVGGLTY